MIIHSKMRVKAPAAPKIEEKKKAPVVLEPEEKVEAPVPVKEEPAVEQKKTKAASRKKATKMEKKEENEVDALLKELLEEE